jgi:hypothetical protein
MSWRGDNRLESNQNRTRHTINASFYRRVLANQIFLPGDSRSTRINRQKNCRQKNAKQSVDSFPNNSSQFFCPTFFCLSFFIPSPKSGCGHLSISIFLSPIFLSTFSRPTQRSTHEPTPDKH